MFVRFYANTHTMNVSISTTFRLRFSVTASPVQVEQLFASLKKALFCLMTNVMHLTNRQQRDSVSRLSLRRVNRAGIRQSGARFSTFSFAPLYRNVNAVLHGTVQQRNATHTVRRECVNARCRAAPCVAAQNSTVSSCRRRPCELGRVLDPSKGRRVCSSSSLSVE